MACEVLLTYAGYSENPLVNNIEYTKYGYDFKEMKKQHPGKFTENVNFIESFENKDKMFKAFPESQKNICDRVL